MERLEKILVPIALAVALGAWGLTNTSPDTAILVAKIFGLFLVVVLLVGSVMRVVVRKKRARRAIEESLVMLDRLESEMAAQSAANEAADRAPNAGS